MFQVGASCYATSQAANEVSASAQAGSVVLIGGQSYALSVAEVTGTAVTYVYSPASGGATISQTVAMLPPTCGLLTAADASDIAWMIAVAWVAAFCIKFLARAVRNESDEVKYDA
jgi:hypothetical protein